MSTAQHSVWKRACDQRLWRAASGMCRKGAVVVADFCKKSLRWTNHRKKPRKVRAKIDKNCENWFNNS